MGFKVRAIEKGYYGLQVRYPKTDQRQQADEFEIDDPSHFSSRWMEPVGWDPKAGKKKAAAPAKAKPVEDAQAGGADQSQAGDDDLTS